MKIGPHLAYEVQKKVKHLLDWETCPPHHSHRFRLQKRGGQLAWELKNFGPPHCRQAQELVGQLQQKSPE
ncbi:hypothetical protein E2C01_101983 [Portunus trituberculatus]|uniref:Uncharacterized protein n=1 Tax=Portunus trituberculatus TaxID=210409 RepID=A0A5B7KG70_PORTR|nr:hypothetical protein [Portunus trituberculatus]